MTEGALVAQAEHTHVATIQRLNPIYADFTQSAAEISRLRREFETGALERSSARVRLILDNSETYPFDGRLLFSDTTVDPGTMPPSVWIVHTSPERTWTAPPSWLSPRWRWRGRWRNHAPADDLTTI